MDYDPAQKVAFYRSLLISPGERDSVDYKASLPLGDNDSFSLKLFRHIMGMANSNGGWIVIGFKEDANKLFIPDPAHTETVFQSYDTTAIANKVNSFVQGRDRLSVYVNQVTHEQTQLRYPIIQVNGFTRRPFFCKSTRKASDIGEEILTDGALYVRRPSGETVRMTDPSDWEALIDRCLTMRRSEFLRELEDLLTRMGLTISSRGHEAPSPTAWAEEMRHRATGR